MAAASLVILLLTIAFGAVVLGFWSAPTGQRGDRRSAAFVTAHMGVAAVAVLLLVAYLIGRSGAVGGAAIAAVATTIALGSSSFASSRTRRSVPAAVLVVHGAFAAAALTVVIATVARG
jgi:uncharacterized membrane protein (UPF0136 family)